jgi:hypothetical protein
MCGPSFLLTFEHYNDAFLKRHANNFMFKTAGSLVVTTNARTQYRGAAFRTAGRLCCQPRQQVEQHTDFATAVLNLLAPELFF